MHREYGKNPKAFTKLNWLCSVFKMSALPLARNISCFQPSKISNNKKSKITSYISKLLEKSPSFHAFGKSSTCPTMDQVKSFLVRSLHLCHTPPVALLHCRELLLMFICSTFPEFLLWVHNQNMKSDTSIIDYPYIAYYISGYNIK